MTTTLILLIIFVGLVIVANNHLMTDSEISVLRDITDKHLSQPNPNEIIKLYNLKGLEKWSGGLFPAEAIFLSIGKYCCN